MPVTNLVLAIFFGLLGGAVLAAAVYAPGSRKAFERDKAKFEAGGRWDPHKRPAGPHRSYLANFLFFGALCLTMFMLYFRYAAPPL